MSVPTSARPPTPLTPTQRGQRLATLLLTTDQWIDRRVESIRFLPTGESRRSISFDFTLRGHDAVPGSRDRVLVPLALISKGTLRRLDVADASGGALPVLRRGENARLAVDALESLAEEALEGRPGEDLEWVKSRIGDVVNGEPADARVTASEVVGRLAEWHDALPADEDDRRFQLELLAWGIAEFTDKFWFVVEIPYERVDTRTIVKVSYDMAFDPPSRIGELPAVIDLDMPQMRVAKSVHLEVAAPEGLEISRLTLLEYWTPVEDEDDGEHAEVDPSGDGRMPGHLAHVATYSRQPWSSDAQAWVELMPHRRGLVSVAALGSLVGLALLTLPFMVTLAGADWWGSVIGDGGRSGSVAAILLAAPALLAAWFARPAEHALVGLVLWRARRCLLATSSTLFVSAVLTATGAGWTLASVVGALMFAVQLLVTIDAVSMASTVRGWTYSDVLGGSHG
ncbi:MAG: hypothetical protein AB7O74_06980 [Candidatus Nanopelagicales bacterium]